MFFKLSASRLGTVLFCLAAASFCAAPGCKRSPRSPRSPSGSGGGPAYGQRVKYKENQDLRFPDFTLRYVGQTKEIFAVYPRGFIYYNFVVKASGTEHRIRWSSGTGLIAPLDFEASGKPFWLELQASDKYGALAPDELVVSQRDTMPPPPPKQAK